MKYSVPRYTASTRNLRRGSGLVNSGFTIVELLIVIIVIAILAALVIAGYGGIQRNARNSQTLTVVRSYVSAVKSYAAENDAYPTLGASSYPCLGEGYSNGCGTVSGTPVWSVAHTWEDAAFHNLIRKYFGGGTLPLPNKTPITIESGQSVAGAYYHSSYITFISYYLEGNVDCGKPGMVATKLFGDNNATLCRVTFPAL